MTTESTGSSAAPEPLSRLADQFTELARALLTENTVLGVLGRVVDAARDIVPGADVVSVTLRNGDGRYLTPAYSDPIATRLDVIQYESGEGPCVTATEPGGADIVTSAELDEDARWRTFGPLAAREGMHSLLAVGLFPDSDPNRAGALNFYARTPGSLDLVDRDIALLLAAHAATALAATSATAEAELRVGQLEQALDSRDVIGQAKGILMERRRLSAEEAFEVLVRASQSLNIKLTEIARTVVTRHREL
ncbi:MAG TPA: ANTAR domain-containing protein [Pseudonocardiaceae bacterium]|nr:ANTAR domain-containing protein [Pseudonocardiaceae bacterium]